MAVKYALFKREESSSGADGDVVPTANLAMQAWALRAAANYLTRDLLRPAHSSLATALEVDEGQLSIWLSSSADGSFDRALPAPVLGNLRTLLGIRAHLRNLFPMPFNSMSWMLSKNLRLGDTPPAALLGEPGGLRKIESYLNSHYGLARKNQTYVAQANAYPYPDVWSDLVGPKGVAFVEGFISSAPIPNPLIRAVGQMNALPHLLDLLHARTTAFMRESAMGPAELGFLVLKRTGTSLRKEARVRQVWDGEHVIETMLVAKAPAYR